ncbi:MAG: shikimate dehydrogenase [Thermodesulfobacteriota bacterium]|nr:shikimate dehydrogenase [Thermodesulfobacteriota bacterium]
MKETASISASTQICAVVGNPIAHSLSPAIHNAAFAECGLDFVYVAFRVEDIKHSLMGMRAMENFRGMSVTIPHKVESMKYLDDIPDVDRHIGSINTIINEQGRLMGLGTDGPGALKAIVDAGIVLEGRNVLLLGAGGAARAIAFTLAGQTGLSQLGLLDVDKGMLKRLASDLKRDTNASIKAEEITSENLSRMVEEAHLIMNCTPVGMHPHVSESLVPVELLRPDQVIFDIVYNPLETQLCAEAKVRGLKVIHGVEMFVNQAVLQFERFTGVNAPIDVMRRVVMEHLTQ